MKKILLPVLTLSICMLLASCSSVRIVSDYDHNRDFASYKKYLFLPWSEHNSSKVNDFDQARIYTALEAELAKRGFQKVQKGADVAVNVMIIMEQQRGTTAYTSYYGHYGYYSPFGFGYSTVHYDHYNYWQGTMIIDMFDTRDKKLVWQGAAVANIDEISRNKERAIPGIVSRIFLKYPVKAER